MSSIIDSKETDLENTQITIQDWNGNKHFRTVKTSELNNYQRGMLIQNAFPHMSINDKELIISGITSDDWDEIFNEEE